MRPVLLGLLVLLAADPAEAIVNGDAAPNPRFQAVVYLALGNSACTGTFIHPHFILTAAHCLPDCARSSDRGCITGDIKKGIKGRDGAVTGFDAFDGEFPRTGNRYAIDYVYFPTAAEMGQSRAPDIALLRTVQAFKGRVLPVLPHQDRPRPPESRYCRRWEFTWPWVVGYSDNAESTIRRRRVGRAFAECDIEGRRTVFKLDGHGRHGQRGIRICPGDSGGPVLWQTGFGGFGVGGVNSLTETANLFRRTDCPSERGEGSHAFIPSAFLDRVAKRDPLCEGARSWEECRGFPAQYGGHTLRYIGTTIDQCGRSKVVVSAARRRSVVIRRGETKAFEVCSNRFSWKCGSCKEWTTAPSKARFVIAKRGLTDRQIIWDCYQILAYPPGVVAPPRVEVKLGSERDKCSGTLRVKRRDGKYVKIRRGKWTVVDVKLGKHGHWYWKCGGCKERSRGRKSFRYKVKRLKVYHAKSGRTIKWTCLGFECR